MSPVRRRVALAAVLWVAAASACGAVQPDEVLHDAGLEARARALSAQLRCLVCQNQSIDDSAAPLARDLRLIVRERLVSGDSDGQVKAFLVQRYGDFVLLRPPFDRETLLLWLTPVLVLLTAGSVILRRRSGSRPATAAPLDPDEEARVAALLADPRTG